MASITQVREAIADAVATISGLRATPLITDQVNPPQAVVWRKQIDYSEVQHTPGDDGLKIAEFGVTVYVQRESERAAQGLLDDYADTTGATSVKAAVETDSALQALVHYAVVTSVDEVKIITVGQVDYLTEEFVVQVAY